MTTLTKEEILFQAKRHHQAEQERTQVTA